MICTGLIRGRGYQCFSKKLWPILFESSGKINNSFHTKNHIRLWRNRRIKVPHLATTVGKTPRKKQDPKTKSFRSSGQVLEENSSWGGQNKVCPGPPSITFQLCGEEYNSSTLAGTYSAGHLGEDQGTSSSVTSPKKSYTSRDFISVDIH